LREALKYLGKAETRQASDMAEMTERRIDLMEQFVRARKALQVTIDRQGDMEVVGVGERAANTEGWKSCDWVEMTMSVFKLSSWQSGQRQDMIGWDGMG
jgi:hypothetical protein